MAMFGCDSRVRRSATSPSASNFAGSARIVGDSTFTATVRPSRVSRARYTSPMPPVPSDSRILKSAIASGMVGLFLRRLRRPELDPAVQAARIVRHQIDDHLRDVLWTKIPVVLWIGVAT